MGRPEQQTASRLLREYFFARIDIVAACQSWVDRKSGETISRPRPVRGENALDDLIAFHVVGPSGGKAPPLNYINRRTSGQVADGRGFDRLGSYTVAPDDTASWLCLDFDGPGFDHSKGTTLADPLATMMVCYERCRELGIPVHIEKSGSGAGWHLWVFFEKPVPAVDARLLGHFVAPVDQPLVTGEIADVRNNRGIECFPKQNKVSSTKHSAGNLVWLPFWFGAKDGGNRFYVVGDNGELAPHDPRGFERFPVADLAAIIDQVPDDLRNAVLKKRPKKQERNSGPRPPSSSPSDYPATDSDLVIAALDSISPDCSYDDWVRIGMALHEWEPQAGLSIWDSWSARGDKYVAGEPDDKWDSFTSGGGVTLGTLFDMAKKAGWEPPRHDHPPLPTDEEIAAFMDIDPAELIDGVKSKKRREILECLIEAEEPLAPKDVAERLGRDQNSTRVLLHRMAKDEQILRDEQDHYILPQKVMAEPAATITSGPKSNGDHYIEAESNGAAPPKVMPDHYIQPKSNGPHPKKVMGAGPKSNGADRPRLPTIIVKNRQLRHEKGEAWDAVHASNYPPRLFQRSGGLVRLVETDDAPVIMPVNETALMDHLSQVANWIQRGSDTDIPVHPPKDVVAVMVESPDKKLPHLENVVTTPVFGPDGSLIAAPGYHTESRLWMHRPLGFDMDGIPESPSSQEIERALDLLLNDLFVDFPFTSESDRCHALAALLLPFVRRMVHGPTPIHLVEAPTPGTGKSLLAEMIALVCTGHSADVTTLDKQESETRKKITAILATAPLIVHVDNLRKGLLSSQIAAAITAEIWWDRILQVSKMIRLPNRAMWIATANNPALSLENARRSIRIRVDAKVDRPGRRSGFKHVPLRKWVQENRRDLVRSVLTIVRGWVAAGMPATDQVLGSFESWSRVVGGILQWAGVPGFLANAEELMEVADAEGNEWREFVSAWWDKYGDRWVIVSELFELALNDDYLPNALGDKSPRSQKTRLGLALGSMRDRQFGHWRIIVRRATRGSRSEYRLAQVDGPESDGNTGPEVLPLFGRRSATSTERLPQRLPNISEQNQEDTDLVDVGRPLGGYNAYAREKNTPAYRGPRENVYQRLNVYQDHENKEEKPGRPLVDVDSTSTESATTPATAPIAADLAHFDPEEEE